MTGPFDRRIHVDGREPVALPPLDWCWREYRPDGTSHVNGVELPPLPTLERRAVAITIGGCLVRQRAPYAQMDWREWEDHKELYPGRLDLTVKVDGAGLRYAVSFIEAGDDECPLNYTIPGDMSAALALAWVVAVAQEHHAEVCAGQLEHTGGLA
jgi:hypothetical protein